MPSRRRSRMRFGESMIASATRNSQAALVIPSHRFRKVIFRVGLAGWYGACISGRGDRR